MNPNARIHVGRAAYLVALPILAVLGCSKSSGGAAACTYHHTSPNFCLAPPAGYTAQPEKPSGDDTRLYIQPGSNSGRAFRIEWLTVTDPTKDELLAANWRDNEKSRNTINDDGQGGYWYDTVGKSGFDPSKTYHSIFASVKGPKGRLKCWATSAPGDETEAAALLAACRSLRWE
jgi:hypothetical protein